MYHINIKRAYEEPKKSDGKRILVDRLWPRGLKKAEAQVNLWLKDIAPSTTLRKWFGHQPSKWEGFKKRYSAELERNTEQVSLLERELRAGKVTLVYGAKDQEHNGAIVLKEFLEEARNNSHKML
ncbi:MAG: DUF488 domain-containing protein [Terrimicrobium sp.]